MAPFAFLGKGKELRMRSKIRDDARALFYIVGGQ